MTRHHTPNTIHQTLSVVLATRNEQENIGDCLESVKDIADEIVIVDEESTDKTREIAKRYGAKVYKVKHEPIFHKTKQKALDYATGDWILQLDADERVTRELREEIDKVVKLSGDEVIEYQKLQNSKHPKLQKLFQRHQKLIEVRDRKIGKDIGQVVAFFIPRLNFFLRKPLTHAGVYPDASVRLIKNGKARFPAKSVHEQMEVDGEVAWLFNDLLHNESPTFERYLSRMNRYTDLHAQELQNSKTPKNLLFLIHYSLFKPLFVFLKLYIRHLGFLGGMRGFIWSFFSALHFPLAYFKYWQMKKG